MNYLEVLAIIAVITPFVVVMLTRDLSKRKFIFFADTEKMFEVYDISADGKYVVMEDRDGLRYEERKISVHDDKLVAVLE